MLPFFPAGLPGELFASRVSHYHVLSGNLTVHDTFKELFQGGLFSLTHWVPKKLDLLAAKIAGDQQAILQGFYRDSTLLPLFRLFAGLPFRNAAGVVEGGIGDRIPRRIVGESGSTCVCVKCLAENAEEYGTPFIHCTHQTPSVTSCWHHCIQLIDRCPNCRCPIEPPKGLILAPWKGCPCGQDFLKIANLAQPSSREAEVSLARFAKVLLDYSRNLDRHHNLAEVYRARALELGFRRGNKIDRAGLLVALEGHFGKSLLAKIDSAYRQGRTNSWLFDLSRPSLSESPITRHLILANYLFREPEAFISQLCAMPALPTTFGRRAQNTRHRVVDADCNSGTSSKDRIDETLDRLVDKGRRYRLSVDDLWKAEYATMKWLVRLRPDTGQRLEQLLTQPDTLSVAKRDFGDSIALVSEKDMEWADAIKCAGNQVYAETARPMRVSMSVLLNRATIRPTQWPVPDVFPKTRAICEELVESRWHFYARRLIWTIHQLNGRMAGRAVIAKSAGLENVRASDVLAYFSEIGLVPTSEAAVAQLERVGITKQWEGPNPDRTYENVGRNYVPRKSQGSQGQTSQRKAASDLHSNDD